MSAVNPSVPLVLALFGLAISIPAVGLAIHNYVELTNTEETPVTPTPDTDTLVFPLRPTGPTGTAAEPAYGFAEAGGVGWYELDGGLGVATAGTRRALFGADGGLYVGTTEVTPDASALLRVQSNTQGLGLPSLSGLERDAVANPLEGLSVYNNTTKSFDFFDGTSWQAIAGGVGATSLGALTNVVTSGTSGTVLQVTGSSVVLGDGATSGSNNNDIAIGADAAVDGSNSMAIGVSAKAGVGVNNVVMGRNTGSATSTGTSNVILGDFSAQNLTSGSNNTLVGRGIAGTLQSGNGNSGVGNGISFSATTANCAIVGLQSASTAGNVAILGSFSSSTASNVVVLGTDVDATVPDSIWIRPDVTPVSGTALHVLGSGQVGPDSSSLRFKQELGVATLSSEQVLRLQAKTYYLKKDPTKKPTFGLMAEEVYEIAPELVYLDQEGKPLSVDYARLSLLLMDYLKNHDFETRLAAVEARLRGMH